MRWTRKNESVERQPHYRDSPRGGIHGCDPDDWLQTERELQEKYNKSSRE